MAEASEATLIGSSGASTSAQDIEWVMTGEAEAVTPKYIQLATIRDTTMNTLMREVISLHDTYGWVPDLETAKALACRWVQWLWEYRDDSTDSDPEKDDETMQRLREQADSINVTGPEVREQIQKYLNEIRQKDHLKYLRGHSNAGDFVNNSPPLPWPKACKHKKDLVIGDGEQTWFEDKYSPYAMLTKGSKNFGDVYVTDPLEGRDSFRRVLGTVFNKMSLEDKLALSTYLLTYASEFQHATSDYVYLWDIYDFGLDEMDLENPLLREAAHVAGLGKALVHVYQDRSLSVVRSVLNGYRLDRLLYESLASGEFSQEDIRLSIGIRMKENGIGGELTILRQFMADDENEPVERRSRIEGIVRDCLGLSAEKPIYDSLNRLYDTIQFENYPVSRAIERTKASQLVRIMRKYGIKWDDQILEIGSGVGWLLDSLRMQGYTHIHGIDASERHVNLAKSTYGDYFEVGSWYDIPQKYRHARAILSIGRNLPHAEDPDRFNDVLHEVHKTLGDGYFIFDMPDPTRGAYAENVAQYRSVLRRLGYTDAEVKSQWYVVDSPDGQNYYNRYVPPPWIVVEQLLFRDFEVEAIYSEPIPNGKGDWNITFVARKRTEEKKFGQVHQSNRFSAREKVIKEIQERFTKTQDPPAEFH